MPTNPRLTRLRDFLAVDQPPAESDLRSIVLDLWDFIDRWRTTDELREYLSPGARVRLRVALGYGVAQRYLEETKAGLWQRGPVEPPEVTRRNAEAEADRALLDDKIQAEAEAEADTTPPAQEEDTLTTTDPESERKPRNGRRRRYRRNPLTPEQERDLISVYTDTDRSITQIAKLFDVQGTYPYRVLDKNGIGWRRDSTQSFKDWARANGRDDLIVIDEASQPTVVQAPAPGYPARVEVPTPGLTDKLDAMAAMVDSERHVPELPVDFAGPAAEWVVEITERFSVSANSIESAVAEARRIRRNGRITGVHLREPER